MKDLRVILIAIVAFVTCVPPLAMADTWGDQINDPTRFVVLPGYGGAAVLDQETGLVWEQSPDNTNTPNWFNSQLLCNIKTVGNRKGWRLPTLQELASLVDPTQSLPSLPPGHPFSNVVSSGYWSATTVAADTSSAWVVNFGGGLVDTLPKSALLRFHWCVRGGQGVDLQ